MAIKAESGGGDLPTNYFQDIDKVFEKAGVRYGKSYSDFDKSLHKFNVSRLPNYNHPAEPYIAHIIMTRPSLFIGDASMASSAYEREKAVDNYTQMLKHPICAGFTSREVGKTLLRQLSEFNPSPYLPIISERAMNYSVGDAQLKTVEKGNTYYGHMIKYGKHSEEHKIGGSISIDFRNDEYLTILQMMYIWMSYIYLVSKGDVIKPSSTSQMNGILDYCGSIYYLVTRRDARELVYWEKLTGVFPKSAPFSMFSYSDSMILEDRYSIEFDYGIRSDPCDPNVLFDLNTLSSNTYEMARNLMINGSNNRVLPYRYNEVFTLGDQWADFPYIRLISKNGSMRYILEYRSNELPKNDDHTTELTKGMLPTF